MPTTNQIIRIVIFALIFVVPVLIRLIKVASDAKEKRRLEALRQYQVNEAMRTGRPVAPIMAASNPALAPPPYNPQQSAQDRLREMAARRQAQIEALRRQRIQAPQGAPPPSRPATAYQQTAGESAATAFQQKPGVATGYQQQAPVATGYQQKAPVSTGYQAVSSARPAARQQAPRQNRRAPQVRAQPQRQAPVPQTVEQAFPPPTGEIGGSSHDHHGDVTHRLVPDAPSTPATPHETRNKSGKGDLSRAAKVDLSDLRRAIVLREVLGTPLALRQPGEAP